MLVVPNPKYFDSPTVPMPDLVRLLRSKAVLLPGVRVTPGSRWGLHICRNRVPEPAHYVWSWVGKSNHNREAYGALIV